MLQNASLLAIVAVDTEENEPIKNEVWWVRRHFLGPRLRLLSELGENMDVQFYEVFSDECFRRPPEVRRKGEVVELDVRRLTIRVADFDRKS